MEPINYTHVKAFGGSAACTIEANSRKEGISTINIEVAAKQGNTFDWQNKIMLELTPSELSELAALFLGLKMGVHFKRPEKGVEIQRQQGNLFIKASAGRDKQYRLPVTPGDVFLMSALVINQLQKHSKMTNQQAMLQALRGAYSL